MPTTTVDEPPHCLGRQLRVAGRGRNPSPWGPRVPNHLTVFGCSSGCIGHRGCEDGCRKLTLLSR
eukprot:7825451-Pyramimonas_sp.AAC.1